MEAAQAHTKRANLPISNEALVATTNHAMLGTDEYVDEIKVWNKCCPDKPTWDNWKPAYQDAYTTYQRSNTIRGEKVLQFGGSAVA